MQITQGIKRETMAQLSWEKREHQKLKLHPILYSAWHLKTWFFILYLTSDTVLFNDLLKNQVPTLTGCWIFVSWMTNLEIKIKLFQQQLMLISWGFLEN